MGEISSFQVNWQGDKVEANVREATRWGIDSTMADCVVTAMSEHNWENRTGILTGSIRMQPAVDQGDAITGYWGSFAVIYARFLELGTRFIPQGKYTWLQPSAERHYPSLALRIRAKLEWG
jgi:hypothetical protein